MCLLLQERIKEVTDKFNAELEADRQKFELLLQEKNEQELEYEEKLTQVGCGGGGGVCEGGLVSKRTWR
jgi:hypothetical protein